MSKKIIIALVLIILLGALVFWLWRGNIFSREVLKLEILGRETAKMGEEIEYTVKYKNNGNSVLQEPRLIFELPEHSVTEDGKTRFTEDLNDIYPGDEDFIKFKARLLGAENDLKVAKALLSYVPKNLSVRFESDTTFTTKIDSVPLTLDFDLPSKAERGKQVEYSLNYFSNADYPLENLSIKIDAVSGFQIESSEPSSLDFSEWRIPTLEKTQGGRIKIKGRVTGETGGILNFGAKLGTWRDGEFVLIKSAAKEVSVTEALLFITQRINGSSNYVASPAEELHYEISFRNISQSPFDNLFLLVRLDGKAIDLSTISSQTGEVRRDDRLIAWDKNKLPELEYLAPQQEGKVEFTLKLKDNFDISGSEINNVVIKNKVDISQISQEFYTKVNSKIEVLQNGYYREESGISNSGPVPPRVAEPTTYTIKWEVKNYFNDVKNVKVKAVLPHNVNLTGKISPESESSSFLFDSQSREIVWNVAKGGNLLAGTGILGPFFSVAFQVSLTPDSSQRGQSANIIGEATIIAEDLFTGSTTQGKTQGIDTSLPDDSNNGGVVQ